MIEVNFQQLDSIKLPLLKPIYKQYYPSAKAKKSETIIVGYDENQIVSVVRFRPIENFSLLTGMLVIPDYRSQGIANQMLHFCQTEYLNQATYCFAYEHLEKLYQAAGFQTLPLENLPPTLKQLFLRYTANGKKLLPMQYKATVLT
ncbi:GNAT family N-acetyltransferase [Vibrio gangliei]|uniref:GNAT family N-acetyltransferase n=1 Tax=Vibrio gangliei TaxID=2077090 RepID=UPI000D01994B|nr:GNAT family N-acetyltransferase [Vibrio gangliei]